MSCLSYLREISATQPENTDPTKYLKMLFLYNSIQDGWTVKKKEDVYIFSKKHHNKKEVWRDEYLTNFITSNLQEDTPK
jgi:hypothetical protein